MKVKIYEIGHVHRFDKPYLVLLAVFFHSGEQVNDIAYIAPFDMHFTEIIEQISDQNGCDEALYQMAFWLPKVEGLNIAETRELRSG